LTEKRRNGGEGRGKKKGRTEGDRLTHFRKKGDRRRRGGKKRKRVPISSASSVLISLLSAALKGGGGGGGKNREGRNTGSLCLLPIS